MKLFVQNRIVAPLWVCLACANPTGSTEIKKGLSLVGWPRGAGLCELCGHGRTVIACPRALNVVEELIAPSSMWRGLPVALERTALN
jgi:hypothetical protein